MIPLRFAINWLVFVTALWRAPVWLVPVAVFLICKDGWHKELWMTGKEWIW